MPSPIVFKVDSKTNAAAIGFLDSSDAIGAKVLLDTWSRHCRHDGLVISPWMRFDLVPPEIQTSGALQNIRNAIVPFRVIVDQAVQILKVLDRWIEQTGCIEHFVLGLMCHCDRIGTPGHCLNLVLGHDLSL